LPLSSGALRSRHHDRSRDRLQLFDLQQEGHRASSGRARERPADLGQDVLATYQFNTRVAKHHFCSVCGIHVFTRPRAAPELYTINVRTLDDFDLSSAAVETVAFDGRNWEQAAGQLK